MSEQEKGEELAVTILGDVSGRYGVLVDGHILQNQNRNPIFFDTEDTAHQYCRQRYALLLLILKTSSMYGASARFDEPIDNEGVVVRGIAVLSLENRDLIEADALTKIRVFGVHRDEGIVLYVEHEGCIARIVREVKGAWLYVFASVEEGRAFIEKYEGMLRKVLPERGYEDEHVTCTLFGLNRILAGAGYRWSDEPTDHLIVVRERGA
jgi:hypothetical protein